MTKTIPPSIPHEEVMMDMLRNDPEFAVEYVEAALDEASIDAEGQAILLDVVKRITAAQCTTKGRNNVS